MNDPRTPLKFGLLYGLLSWAVIVLAVLLLVRVIP